MRHDRLRFDIDDCLSRSSTFRIFIDLMQKRGYDFDLRNENVTVNHPSFEKPIWLSDLGEGYSIDDIEKYIIEKRQRFRRRIHDSITVKDLFFDGNPNIQINSLKDAIIYLVTGLAIMKERPHCNREVEEYLELELLKFDQLIEEQHLLVSNDLNNTDDIANHKMKLQKEISELTEARRKLRNQLKCAPFR